MLHVNASCVVGAEEDLGRRLQVDTSKGSGFSSLWIELQNFLRWMKFPPPFTHNSWMEFFKLSLSLKGHAEEMMPIGRGLKSYLFLSKGRTKSTSHQLQAPFHD
jgi:hypothetical protein